jgi:hypothetical protein
LKTTVKISKNNSGLSILQKIPRKEFLYLSLMVLSAKLRTAFLKPIFNSVFSNVYFFTKVGICKVYSTFNGLNQQTAVAKNLA